MSMRTVAAALTLGLMVWPWAAWAYRPFDTTDAAVADLHAIEIELSPLSIAHGDEGTAFIAPSLRLNYGFADNWEVVLEGEGDHFKDGHSQLSEAALSVKTVLRDGSLQDKTGVSLASEASILLPGIGAENGAGLEWTGMASERFDWGTVHLNLAAILTRQQRGGVFAGAIAEGPGDWPVRPVAELNYQREFGAEEEYSALVGAIWQVNDRLAFDLAYRHGEIDSRPDEQVRMGVTFDL